eukprot:TRINITY_DN41945_c0_g1_i1.p1 TRINITY_DN41945_c0_g1~~TRINITY_DN41945_c0_g1_i1.p1  ORF type:complete len:448 (-),score=80.95 TRINITY_DN41945_c0_g1_i1:99-1442(-)
MRSIAFGTLVLPRLAAFLAAELVQASGPADDASGGDDLTALRLEIQALRSQGDEQQDAISDLQARLDKVQSALQECGCDSAARLSADLEEISTRKRRDSALPPQSRSPEEEGPETQVSGDTSSHLVHVNLEDEAWVKEVFFGGRPWVLHCLDTRASIQQEVPEVLRESAFKLRNMATFGTINCWDRLPQSQKTLAHRFSLPKPPLTLAVANGDPPARLDLSSVVTAEQLQKLAAQHLGTKITPIDGLAGFKSFCTKRSSCLVIAYRSAATLREASRVLAPILEVHRGVRAVALDASVYMLRLDERLTGRRPVVGSARADVLCLSRGQAPPLPTNKRLAKASAKAGLKGAAREGQKGGAFLQGTLLDPGEVAKFVERCEGGTELLPLLESPWISRRKAGTAASSAGSSKSSKKRDRPKNPQKTRQATGQRVSDSETDEAFDSSEFVEL